MEAHKHKLLRIEEEEWRLKSRALWLKCGDNNTNFFHNFTNQRRIHNSIWDFQNELGQTISSQKDLSEAATKHFKKVFDDIGVPRTEAQFKFFHHYPRYFSPEDNRIPRKEVMLAKIEGFLNSVLRKRIWAQTGGPWNFTWAFGIWWEQISYSWYRKSVIQVGSRVP